MKKSDDADNYVIGSSKHARGLADNMVEIPDGMQMGPSDTAICVKALRHFASRWQRRAVIAVAFAIAAALSVGLPDVNGDGRVGLADLAVAVRHAVGVISPAPSANATVSLSEKKG